MRYSTKETLARLVYVLAMLAAIIGIVWALMTTIERLNGGL